MRRMKIKATPFLPGGRKAPSCPQPTLVLEQKTNEANSSNNLLDNAKLVDKNELDTETIIEDSPDISLSASVIFNHNETITSPESMNYKTSQVIDATSEVTSMVVDISEHNVDDTTKNMTTSKKDMSPNKKSDFQCVDNIFPPTNSSNENTDSIENSSSENSSSISAINKSDHNTRSSQRNDKTSSQIDNFSSLKDNKPMLGSNLTSKSLLLTTNNQNNAIATKSENITPKTTLSIRRKKIMQAPSIPSKKIKVSNPILKKNPSPSKKPVVKVEDNHPIGLNIRCPVSSTPNSQGTKIAKMSKDVLSLHASKENNPPLKLNNFNISLEQNNNSLDSSKDKTSKPGKELIEKKKLMREKFADGIDRQKMTLFDLIYINPSNNPMPGRHDYSKKKTKSGDDNSSSCPSNLAEEQQIDDAGLDQASTSAEDSNMGPPSVISKHEDGEDQQGKELAPQLKIGPDGSIIIDEDSLKIKTTKAKEKDLIDLGEAIEETEYSRKRSWARKGSRSRRWTEKETIRFYRALSTVGTDFGFMATRCFTNRTREELKNKFKKEEKKNLWLVDKALKDKQMFGGYSIFEDDPEVDPIEEKREEKERKKREKAEKRVEEKQRKKEIKEEEKKRKSTLKDIFPKKYRQKKSAAASIKNSQALLRPPSVRSKMTKKSNDHVDPEKVDSDTESMAESVASTAYSVFEVEISLQSKHLNERTTVECASSKIEILNNEGFSDGVTTCHFPTPKEVFYSQEVQTPPSNNNSVMPQDETLLLDQLNTGRCVAVERTFPKEDINNTNFAEEEFTSEYQQNNSLSNQVEELKEAHQQEENILINTCKDDFAIVTFDNYIDGKVIYPEENYHLQNQETNQLLIENHPTNEENVEISNEPMVGVNAHQDTNVLEENQDKSIMSSSTQYENIQIYQPSEGTNSRPSCEEKVSMNNNNVKVVLFKPILQEENLASYQQDANNSIILSPKRNLINSPINNKNMSLSTIQSSESETMAACSSYSWDSSQELASSFSSNSENVTENILKIKMVQRQENLNTKIISNITKNNMNLKDKPSSQNIGDDKFNTLSEDQIFIRPTSKLNSLSSLCSRTLPPITLSKRPFSLRKKQAPIIPGGKRKNKGLNFAIENQTKIDFLFNSKIDLLKGKLDKQSGILNSNSVMDKQPIQIIMSNLKENNATPYNIDSSPTILSEDVSRKQYKISPKLDSFKEDLSLISQTEHLNLSQPNNSEPGNLIKDRETDISVSEKLFDNMSTNKKIKSVINSHNNDDFSTSKNKLCQNVQSPESLMHGSLQENISISNTTIQNITGQNYFSRIPESHEGSSTINNTLDSLTDLKNNTIIKNIEKNSFINNDNQSNVLITTTDNEDYNQINNDIQEKIPENISVNVEFSTQNISNINTSMVDCENITLKTMTNELNICNKTPNKDVTSIKDPISIKETPNDTSNNTETVSAAESSSCETSTNPATTLTWQLPVSDIFSQNNINFINVELNGKQVKVEVPPLPNETMEIFVVRTPLQSKSDQYVFHVYALSPINKD